MVAAGVAAVELVVLLAGGTLMLAHRSTAATVPAKRPAKAVRVPAVHLRLPKVKSIPLGARSQAAVLVLNGNGVAGAASTAAAHLQGLGYRIAATRNATRHDYARSMVMYAPGYAKEARRLARDTGLRLVAPVDGMTPARLKRSPLVLLLGN
jgi:hypothetical protein